MDNGERIETWYGALFFRPAFREDRRAAFGAGEMILPVQAFVNRVLLSVLFVRIL
jgi:hypothetical protein